VTKARIRLVHHCAAISAIAELLFFSFQNVCIVCTWRIFSTWNETETSLWQYLQLLWDLEII